MIAIVFAGLPGPIEPIHSPVRQEATIAFEIGFSRSRGGGRDFYYGVVPE